MGIKKKQRKKRKLTPDEMTPAMLLRRQNRIKRRKRFFRGLLILALLGGLYYGSGQDYFIIKEVTAEGNTHYTGDQISRIAEAKTGVNMFRMRTSPWKTNLLNDPYIREAKVSRKIPDKIHIQVTERQEKYALEYGNRFIVIDSEGVALRFSSSQEGFVVIGGITLEEIILGEPVKDSGQLKNEEKALALLAELEQESMPVKKIVFSDVLVNIHLFDKLIFKTEYDNLAVNLQNLKGILADLQQKGIERGTIRGQDGDLAFSPLIE